MTCVKLRLKCVKKNDAYRSCPKQTVSTVCYKINPSWYPVSSKLVSYTHEHWRLIAPKIVDIYQYGMC